MPQIKHYTAKREMKLDCGHTVKVGEPFQIYCVFACEKDGKWPMSILMACLSVLNRKREFPPAKDGAPVATEKPPAQQNVVSK